MAGNVARIEQFAAQSLSEYFSLYAPNDQLLCTHSLMGVELNYWARPEEQQPASTHKLRMFLYAADGLAWIAELQIAPESRRQGHGRRLAIAAERIALSCGCQSIRIHPRYGVEPFWQQLDYFPTAGSSRIMEKYVAELHCTS